MMNDVKKDFINEITKGFWILPRRKKQIRQEINDHLEDIAEEKDIDMWTEGLLSQHFGSAKTLRSLFIKGGLPMWAKFLKWGIIAIAFIIVLILIIDFGVLFFYKVDPVMLKMVEQDHPFLKTIEHGPRELPIVNYEWLSPGDSEAKKTYDKLMKCIDIIKKPSEINEKEMNLLIETWTSASPDDKLRFPRPTVTSNDIQLAKTSIKTGVNPSFKGGLGGGKSPQKSNKSRDNLSHQYIGNEYMWLQFVQSYYKMNPDTYSIHELVQRAKAFYATSHLHLNIQRILKTLKEQSLELSKKQAAEISKADSIWLGLYLDAVNPNPEPLIDLLVIVAGMGITQNTLAKNIRSVEHIGTFDQALQQFDKVKLDKIADQWPDLDSLKSKSYGVWDIAASTLAMNSVFRAQCSLLQWFCRENSSAYNRFEALKYPPSWSFIALPNFSNAKNRMDVARSYQSLSEAIYLVGVNGLEEKNHEAFMKRFNKINDPFSDEGLKYSATNEEYIFESAGPNRQFDEGLYSPSNGTLSVGDIVWGVKKN